MNIPGWSIGAQIPSDSLDKIAQHCYTEGSQTGKKVYQGARGKTVPVWNLLNLLQTYMYGKKNEKTLTAIFSNQDFFNIENFCRVQQDECFTFMLEIWQNKGTILELNPRPTFLKTTCVNLKISDVTAAAHFKVFKKLKFCNNQAC